MHELRILSGLHRGATLPLDDAVLDIGASEAADVVLVDPGIEDEHASLSPTDTGWVLTASEGQLFGSEDNLPQAMIDLVPGQFARIGQVWIMVADADDRWQEAPSMPQDEPNFDASGLDAMASEFREPGLIEADDTMDAEASDVVPEVSSPAPREKQADAAHVQSTALELDASGAADAAVESPVARETAADENGAKRRRRRIAFIPIAAVAILSAAVAYGMTGKSPKEVSSARKGATAGIWKNDHVKPLAGGRKATPDPRLLTPEEVRQAFRRRLANAELLDKFDLTMDDLAWNLQGNISEEETIRFERLLKSFIEDYHLIIPVNVKVVGAEAMLPFKVKQVITGVDAGIVTQDGERLYVGDELKGVRLVSVQDSLLQFDGKQKITVRW